jgi:acetyltransferase-like isoleucine patch superfamily enzyme
LALLPNRLVGELRIKLLRKAGATIGKDVHISRGVRVIGARGLRIHDDVSIAKGVTLDARGGLQIERGALIGFDSVLLTQTHASPAINVPVHHQGTVAGPVVVGAFVWLGMRTIVLPGVVIGANTIVGAASVVTKNLPEKVVAAGTPARVIRGR